MALLLAAAISAMILAPQNSMVFSLKPRSLMGFQGYPIASRDSEANENQNMNREEEASDDQGGTTSTAHTKDPAASSPELIDVR